MQDLEKLTEEEFNEWYKNFNIYVLNNSIYAYLAYDKRYLCPDNRVIAERKFIKGEPQGNHLLKTTINDSEIFLKRMLNIIYESYKAGNTTDFKEFIIDSELIDNDLVIDFLKKCYNENLIRSLRILGDNYTLTEETYNKISFLEKISVNNSNINNNNINIESPKYKLITGINSDFKLEEDFVIKEDMTDTELRVIVNELNNSIASIPFKIDLRFYNPIRAVDLIQRLDKLGLDKRIDIKILGYTLTENADTYKNLIPLAHDRNIEVSYVCCHDMLGEYTNEPFLIDNFYDSELEPSGKTDILTYIKILEFIENFEKSVEGIDSNIEKIMTAYQYLNDNYYYDVDAGQTKDYGETRDIDKILDTDQIVCTGYANLLSIMCRRIGIPMFTYDAPSHSVNIARVQEKDESGKVIFDKICTFDPTNDSGYYERNNNSIEAIDNKNSYTFFGLNPEETLHRIGDNSYLTLANALSIHPEELLKNYYLGLSASPYFGSYFSDYNALSYMYSMFHLMGYNCDFEKDFILDLVGELQERGKIGEIPLDLIYNAAEKIERRKHPEMKEEEFEDHMDDVESDIDLSIDKRDYLYDMNQPAKLHLNKYDIQTNSYVDTLKNVKTYSESIPNHKHIDVDSIDIGPVYFQDLDNLNTGEIRNHNNSPSEVISNTPSTSVIEEPKEEITTKITTNDVKEPEPTNEEKEEIYDINEILSNGNITINGNIYINGGTVNININNFGQDPNSLSNVTIAGTTIRRPVPQTTEETEEEYHDRIDTYYEEYLPQAMEESSTTYRLTKSQIIQDLPINSKETQIFNAIGMTEEEIEESRRRLR